MIKQLKLKSLLIILVFSLLISMFYTEAHASITMSTASINVKAGETSTVTMTANNSTGDINITSSDPNVATATATSNNIKDNSVNINIKGVSSGTATITISGVAKDTDTGANEGRYSRTITVTVTGTASDNSSANLTNLGIRPNDFSGFSPDKTTYDVTVPEDVQEVEVYATAANSGAKVSGIGKQTLAIGANALNVVVTGTDGATKTYTINVTREGGNTSNTNQATNTEIKNGLSSINITNVELEPKFETGVYEYKAKYIGEDTSLNIEAVTTGPSYTTEIVGNQDLKEGENTITVLVADKDGKNIATYQIIVNKSLVDEEALKQQEEEARKQEEQKKMFIIGGAVIGLIVIIVIALIIRNRRKKAYAEEFSALPFSGLNNEDYDNNDYFDDYNNSFMNENDEEYNKFDDNNEEESDKDTRNSIEDNTDEINIDKAKREELKRKFLEGYNPNNDDYSNDDIEKERKKRHKGKRFK